jgi:hypothetical protein
MGLEPIVDRRTLIELFGLSLLAGPELAFGAQAPAAPQAGRAGGAPITSTPPGARDRFAGVYRLASFGNTPQIGRIYYDRAGRMGAQLHPPGRKPLPAMPTVEDYREMLRGFVAYYGTYDIDESTRRVAHHIESASNPAWIGTDFIRWYEFEPGRLILRTQPNATTPLVWERLPDG